VQLLGYKQPLGRYCQQNPMLFTLTYTPFDASPATDLGYLLYKNPARVQSFELSFGQAHVFYPEATPERCTAALLLDMDPVGLVRRRGSSSSGPLEQYVNDRPYVASSFMSVAISEVFGTAMTGKSRERPELAEKELPLEVQLTVVPCRGGEAFLRRLFEPLGYTVASMQHPLDGKFPLWGDSPYFTVQLHATVRLQDLLAHLYVLIPVLDDEKHYWVDQEEVEKLLRHGGAWLETHPAREQIANRYLKHSRRLTREVLSRLVDEDNADPDTTEEVHASEEQAIEKKISLNEQRMVAVVAALKNSGAKRVLDLGCGEGKLLRELLADKTFEEMVGVDVSYRALEIAHERLHLDQLAPKQKERIQLFQSSLTYRDKRLSGFDAAAVVEVIEHLDLARLSTFERVLFKIAKPHTVVLTTPNVEYNVKFENLPAGKLRHKDHRFEWSRHQFQTWAEGIGQRFGYAVKFLPVGPEDLALGPPTQMAVFTLI
jgi:3' terminal RNA ribose 2'-O-methyltransferase Hen1